MQGHFFGRGRSWRAGAVLIALCLALAGSIVLEAGEPIMEPTPEATAAPMSAPHPAAAQESPRFSMPPMRQYAEVLKRPLFSETRRPPLQAANTQATQLDLNLVGTVITASDRRALVEHGKPPRLERVVEGQEIDDWTVEAIKLDRLVLSRGDSRIEVKVKDVEAPVVPITPGPPPRRARAAVPTVPIPPGAVAPAILPGGVSPSLPTVDRD